MCRSARLGWTFYLVPVLAGVYVFDAARQARAQARKDKVGIARAASVEDSGATASADLAAVTYSSDNLIIPLPCCSITGGVSRRNAIQNMPLRANPLGMFR